jgi:hypothetical protein
MNLKKILYVRYLKDIPYKESKDERKCQKRKCGREDCPRNWTLGRDENLPQKIPCLLNEGS